MICERCKKDQDDSKFTSSSDGGRLPWCPGCRLTAAIRAEIVGPADGASWDELGDRLRDLRAVSHRILNAGILGIVLDERAGAKNAKALPHIKAELENFRAWAAKKAKASGEDAGRLSRLAALDLPGSITDAAQMRARQAVQKWKKGGGNERLPMFKVGAPIFVRDGAWSLLRDGKRFTLRVKLDPGARPHRALKIAGSDGKHWARLAQVCGSPDVHIGDCKIVYDEERRKWYAILAYTFRKPDALAVDLSRAVVVHRGRHNLLSVLSTADGSWRPLARGDGLEEFKRRIGARKAALRRHRRELGSGARGHGEKRRSETYRRLDDYEARYVKTFCQQRAAELVAFCRQHGAGLVVVEDFGGISGDTGRWMPRFPFAQIKGAILWACEKAGITVREVRAEYVSSECPGPGCGALDESFHNVTTGVFHCKACGLSRDADKIACEHLARRAGLDMSAHDAGERRIKELGEALASAKSGATASPKRERLPGNGAGPTREPKAAREPTRKGRKKRASQEVPRDA